MQKNCHVLREEDAVNVVTEKIGLFHSASRKLSVMLCYAASIFSSS